MILAIGIVLIFLAVTALGAPAPDKAVLDVPIHDPVLFRENGVYYIFATGPGVAVWSSSDMVRRSHQT